MEKNLAQLKLVTNSYTGKEYDQVYFTSKCKEAVLKWLTESSAIVPSSQQYNRLVASV